MRIVIMLLLKYVLSKIVKSVDTGASFMPLIEAALRVETHDHGSTFVINQLIQLVNECNNGLGEEYTKLAVKILNEYVNK